MSKPWRKMTLDEKARDILLDLFDLEGDLEDFQSARDVGDLPTTQDIKDWRKTLRSAQTRIRRLTGYKEDLS